VKPTTASKTAPYSWSRRGKWSETLGNLRSNQHPNKLTTPCSGLLTTNNISHPIIHFFQCTLTKTPKPNL
jgi:hypothetical protein